MWGARPRPASWPFGQDNTVSLATGARSSCFHRMKLHRLPESLLIALVAQRLPEGGSGRGRSAATTYTPTHRVSEKPPCETARTGFYRSDWHLYCDAVSDNFRVISSKDFRILASGGITDGGGVTAESDPKPTFRAAYLCKFALWR